MSRSTRTLFFVALVLLSLGLWSGQAQSIPQIQPVNSTLGASTPYMLNYFSTKQIKTTTKFTVDFSQSNIDITPGTISCEIKLNNTAAPSPICTCSLTSTSKKCQMMPNQNATYNTKVEIIFGGLTNPFYLSTQYLPVNIYFSPSIQSQSYTVTVLNIFYQPMPITLNSFSQSEYGVGSTPVSYTFNLSLSYISKNFQMQIQIPSEVSYGTITSELSFYGTVQDINMMQIQSLLIFNIQTPRIVNPNGFMLLTLHGFGNPQFIGNSSSFKIIFQETTAVQNCATCKIAERFTGLIVESKTPGDISVLSFTSSAMYIAQKTNISINLQLYAGIPTGGKVSIYLPPQMTPVIPIYCSNVFGFVISDNNDPYCTYNQSENRIDTQNFAFPFLVSIGNGIISIALNNPIDTRRVSFNFQTFDNQGRTIGKSRQLYYYSAIPLIMTVSAAKNSTEVDSPFTLDAQITLKRQISSSSNQIQLIFPSGVNYNTSNIKCMSALQNLGCTAKINEDGQLYIAMPPPCVQCAVGNKIKFSIFNVKNPSYISDSTQTIYFHTRSGQGIIEASQAEISLVAAPVNLINYNIPSGLVVGSSYNLSLTLIMPEYVVSKGGKISITFSQNTTYCDPLFDQTSGNFLSYDQQLNISSGSSSIQNQIQYFTSSDPSSINRIIMSVCQPGSSSPCLSGSQVTFIIKNLRQGYIPSISNIQNLKISTNLNELISQKSIDMTITSPILRNSPMNISLTPDMTNVLSQYTIQFTSVNVVFGNTIIFQFSPDQNILSSHCEINTDYLVGINYACTNISANTIQITHDLDLVLMISHTIKYSITVNSVQAPSSMQPRTYKLSTYFNSIKNQQFTSTVSVSSAYPLNVSFTKSNNTIGQFCQLAFNVTPKTQLYTSYKIFIMKTMLLVAKADAESSNYIFSQNSTHYTLQKNSQIPDNKTALRAQNVYSTINTGSIVFTTYQSNYKAQTVKIDLPQISPLLLGVSLSSTNRTVGQLTNLTINIDRNNNGGYGQTQIVVELPVNGFTYSMASYEGSLISSSSPKISIPIQVTSPKIITVNIQNLHNMLYVPNPNSIGLITEINPIKITSKKGSTEIIGWAELPSSLFVPNDTFDTSSMVTRSNIKSGQNTNITINYTTKYGQTGNTLQIVLPEGQNSFTATSSCLIGDQPCNIYFSNSTFISLQYTKNKSITLINVLNYHPNTNEIKISLKTSTLYLIEESSAIISPPIALQFLYIDSSASSSIVGSNNNLEFSITSTNLGIEPSNFMIVGLPEKSFTRMLTNADCEIVVGANTYTGCQYTFDSTNMWVKTIKISSFGPFTINAKQTFKLRIYVTNPWTSYPFSNNAIKFTIYKNSTTALSEGIQTLSEIYSTLSSFSPSPISSSTPLQTALQADQQNNITLSINFLGNLYIGTQILVMIPKDTYSNLTEIGTTSNSPYTVFYKEDALYYYTKFAIPSSACPSSICKNYSATLTLRIKNNKFIKEVRNKIIGYAIYDSYAASQFYSQQLDMYSPQQPPNLTVSRSNNNAGQNTTIIISSQLNENHDQITISLDKSVVQTIQSVSCTQTNNQYIVSNIVQTDTKIQIKISGYLVGVIFEIRLNGKNTMEVPRLGISFEIAVRNSTYLLYDKKNTQFGMQLIPYSQGLSLSRSNSVVSEKTPLFLLGDLSNVFQNINIGLYNVYVNGIKYAPPPSSAINMQLDTYTNPSNLQSLQNFSCEISNATTVIYRNSSLSIFPGLTPIVVKGQTVEISMPDTALVNSNIDISIQFQEIQNLSFIRLTTPKFYSKIVNCVGYLNEGSISLTGTLKQQNQTSQTMIVKANSQQFNSNKIVITLQVIGYQSNFNSASANVYLFWQSPSKTYASPFSFMIIGAPISATVTPGSLRTRNITNYQIQAQTLAKAGKLLVTLPPHLSSVMLPFDTSNLDNKIDVYVNSTQLILGDASGYTVSQNADNQYQILVTIPSTSANIRIILKSVPNPTNNKPMIFSIAQSEPNDQTKIYAFTEVSTEMQILDPIYVYQALRNTTKIGEAIQIAMRIQTPGYEEEMVIGFPQSQASIDPSFCYVKVDGIEKGCENIGDNKIKMINVPGNHTYIFRNLRNSEFSQKPAETDKITIHMGVQYQSAQTTPETTVFITPLIVTGELALSKISSSSNKRASYTNLQITVNPQNWDKCDGIILSFSQFAYYIHNNINCYINGHQTQYQMFNHSSLYIQSKQFQAKQMVIQIRNLINYFENGPYIIFTVKEKEEVVSRMLQSTNNLYNENNFGVIDYLEVSNTKIVFQAGSPSTRIILPNNYVGSQSKVIIAINDGQLPTQLPMAGLFYNFGSKFLQCQQDLIQFNQTISLQCTLKKAGEADFYVQLFNHQMVNVPLTSFTKNIKIYDEPTSHCADQMCDLCSSDGSTQYCFVCREGLVSEGGKCVEQCQTNYFDYQGVCTQCSPKCDSCYDFYYNSCLSCSDDQLLDSGICVAQCSQDDHFAYQGFCVSQKQCSDENVTGCRICSDSGFCYQCLPNYEGEPHCQYQQVLPSAFFLFFLIPLVFIFFLFSFRSCYLNGFQTYSNLFIYLLAVIQLFSWIFTVPRLPSIALSMLLIAFILLRIINSIMSYELVYSKLIKNRKESRLLHNQEQNHQHRERQSASDPQTEHPENRKQQDKASEGENDNSSQQQTCKERLCRFSAHFLSCDGYQLLMSKIGKPYLTFEHHKVFQILNMINRIIIMGFLLYCVIVATVLDLIVIPIVGLITGSLIITTRIIKSSCCQNIMNKIRN